MTYRERERKIMPIPATWVQLPGKGRDIGAGANGAVWVIGTNVTTGGFGIFRWNGTSWDQVEGGGVRIAVDPNGVPWIVNDRNQIFQMVGGTWELRPGAGTDIGVGANGAVWVIGTNVTTGGFGIFRWNGTSWDQVAGGGVRIAVDSNGAPWIVNDRNQIFQMVGGTWEPRPGAGTDIGAGVDSTVWVIGTNSTNGGFGIFQWNGTSWDQVDGGGVSISVVGVPYVTNNVENIFELTAIHPPPPPPPPPHNDDDENNDDENNDDENNDDENNDDENNDDENNDDEDDDEGGFARRVQGAPARRPSTRGKGRLTIVGTGITAVAHMSAETIGCITNADIVFYHATNGVTATQIQKLSRRSVDLYEYYGNDKPRRVTYVQMAELMLRKVRQGLNVVGVFHGHPGNFVSPARRALAVAGAEGYETALLPAISAPDCLFADLRVDPGVYGCQILMASRVFASDAIVATSGHVVFLQVSAVGDSGFSFAGYKNAKLAGFFERLIEVYGEDHDAVYYMAPVFPGLAPEIAPRRLAEYRSPAVQSTVGAGMLYVPPSGVSFDSLTSTQAFTNGTAYGAKEKRAVAELASHVTPPDYPVRRTSDPLFKAVVELGTSRSALERYRNSPDEFIAQLCDLTEDERAALRTRNGAAFRRVTTA
jgi:Tetrapyrrole (Corrin/Porphyrin) Methylases